MRYPTKVPCQVLNKLFSFEITSCKVNILSREHYQIQNVYDNWSLGLTTQHVRTHMMALLSRYLWGRNYDKCKECLCWRLGEGLYWGGRGGHGTQHLGVPLNIHLQRSYHTYSNLM